MIRSANQAVRPLTAARDSHGWSVGGCALAELARQYGTPLYVIDEATVESACQTFRLALERSYHGAHEVIYASKALCQLAILRLVHYQGLGIEVVSGGELATAMQAGIPPARIFLQGNAKSRHELAAGIASRVGRFMVDNLDELELLIILARESGCNIDVILRIAPGITADTHDFLRTGRANSKFGLYVPRDLDEAIRLIKAAREIQFRGLQTHVGSQLLAVEPYLAASKVAVALASYLKTAHDLAVEELDIGGGFGMAYVEGDAPFNIAECLASIAQTITQEVRRFALPLPKLMVEPGRAIVGPAGCTIYSVATRKEYDDQTRYLLVDGGMADNPRPITYGAAYSCDAVCSGGTTKIWTLAGKACEEGDVIISSARLPSLTVGDYVVVWGTGAYTFSMASNYNRLTRPAMVLVKQGKAELIRERESYADLIALDRLPEHLSSR
ncbi:MAG: diaminopimelate decarboxylase [Cyanobacteria bacterium NC_groundwater_1444_Ag_S-0.65um_54_12]|nr:diaminopimelate decarboxylase [Cyanobacteria bacterium NC_groundwater_1444_Ag_S-0.65um_54_12]